MQDRTNDVERFRTSDIARRKDRIQRDRQREQDRDIRTAIQSKSASAFLHNMEDAHELYAATSTKC